MREVRPFSHWLPAARRHLEPIRASSFNFHPLGEPMKRLALSTLLVLSTSLPAFGQDKGDDHTPKHGGIVMETKAGDLELVAQPDQIRIYVQDHGKPMKLTSGTGKVTVFNGKEKVEAPLALVGEHLEARGDFKTGTGTRVLAEVSLNGKPAVATRFTLK